MSERYAVILAGGRGTRFWPLSRKAKPKQCIALTDSRSLMRQTIDRLLPLFEPSQILVMTGTDMLEALRPEIKDIPDENILIEPRGRNTAPCIAWAAFEVEKRGGRSLAVLPSDHAIADEEDFRNTLSAAFVASEHTPAIILLGIKPTSPHTGYGYIQMGGVEHSVEPHMFHDVSRFVEKPNLENAKRLITDARYLWNGGMFVFTLNTILSAFERNLPNTHQALAQLRQGRCIEEVWDQTDATSIDYGILERDARSLVVPCRFGWSDVGSWTALEELLPSESYGVARAGGVVSLESSDCVVYAPDQLVALLGVHDLVVVQSEGVLFVGEKNQAQRIGQLVEAVGKSPYSKFL